MLPESIGGDFDRHGDAESSPGMWAMIEEEDDHSILDMSMFSIHTILWNVTRLITSDLYM